MMQNKKKQSNGNKINRANDKINNRRWCSNIVNEKCWQEWTLVGSALFICSDFFVFKSFSSSRLGAPVEKPFWPENVLTKLDWNVIQNQSRKIVSFITKWRSLFHYNSIKHIIIAENDKNHSIHIFT